MNDILKFLKEYPNTREGRARELRDLKSLMRGVEVGRSEGAFDRWYELTGDVWQSVQARIQLLETIEALEQQNESALAMLDVVTSRLESAHAGHDQDYAGQECAVCEDIATARELLSLQQGVAR